MEKHLFNLKFAAKELERNSKKCDKQEKLEKAKAKKCIQNGQIESAKIHAENAIRQKKTSLLITYVWLPELMLWLAVSKPQ